MTKQETAQEWGFGTTAIHAGQEHDPLTGALATPIYQTSTFCFDSVEQGTATFAGERSGYAYTRGGNPTTDTLARKIAAIEHGEACTITASGMGAIGGVLLGLLRPGDHVISGECVYGCTAFALNNTMVPFGVDVSFVDTSDLDAVKAALTDRTRLIFFETPTNPTMKITDIAALSDVAHEAGARVVVDNTFAPPPLQYPLDLGADFVVHSLTKYINGHGDVLAGAIVGPAEDISYLASSVVSKICGATPSPFESYLVIRGMQTLELRMRRHCENGMATARHLQENPLVQAVYYPGLEDMPGHEIAKAQMHGMYGGMLSFELKDGIGGMSSYEAARKLCNALQIAEIAVSLGDPGTLIQHPASMTHNNMTPELREQAHITDGLIRLSLGLENTEDILADFDQAFAVLEGGAAPKDPAADD